MGKSQKKKRMEKCERKNMKFWADGAREKVLSPHIEDYADALQRGWRYERDYLQRICKEFHARIPWRLGDSEEPKIPLPDYDPNAPFVEEELTDDDKVLKAARVKELNERIRRWMKYRAKKLNKGYQSSDPSKNPYATLFAKLTGVNQPPKARQGYQQFMVESWRDVIEPEVKKRWDKKLQEEGIDGSTSKGPDTGFRGRVARELFSKLPTLEQEAVRKRAQTEAVEAREKYQKAVNSPPCTSPEARQRAIDAIPSFMAPILSNLYAYTRCKFFLIYGGPHPKDNGELFAHCCSYGKTLSNSPVPWNQLDRKRFENDVMGYFKEFLCLSFNDEDIKEASMENDPALKLPTDKLYVMDPADDLEPPKSNFDAYAVDSESDSSSSDDEELPPIPKRSKTQPPASAEIHKKVGPLPSKKPVIVKATSSLKSTPKAKNSSTPYSPYSTTDPDGPLISPNPKFHDQVKAYNIARNEREHGALVTELREGFRALSQDLSRSSTPNRHDVNHSGSPPISSSETSKPKSGSAIQQTSKPSSPVPQNAITRQEHIGQDIPIDEKEAEDSQPPRKNSDSSSANAESGMVQERPSPSPGSNPASPQTSGRCTPAPPPGPTREKSTSRHDSPSRVEEVDQQLNASIHGENDASPLQFDPSSSTLPPRKRKRLAIPEPDKNVVPRSRQPIPIIHSAPERPSDAPKWMLDAYLGLTAVPPLGLAFNDLISAFIRLEQLYGYQNPPRGLPPSNRPALINDWIKNGRWRKSHLPPNPLPDPVAFSISWREWWRHIQPAWAELSGGLPTFPPANVDAWKSLRHPGNNGLLGPLVGLLWWGCALRDMDDATREQLVPDWTAALTHVKHVIDGLCVLAEASRSP